MKKVLIGSLVGVSLLAGLIYYFYIPLYYTYLNSIKITELTVEGKTITMNNLINSKTLEQFKEIFQENIDIDTLVLKQIDGSIDDEANLKLAQWLYKKELKFILLADSSVASGGTDLFLAGKERIIHKGAKIGIHSWATGAGKVATDYPVGNAVHQKYIDYYMNIGWDKKKAEKFYYFTINSALASSIYWMTDQEIELYGMNTEALK